MPVDDYLSQKESSKQRFVNVNHIWNVNLLKCDPVPSKFFKKHIGDKNKKKSPERNFQCNEIIELFDNVVKLLN